jgi:ketosteroid isomerase-like protein
LQTLETTRQLGEVDRALVVDLMDKFFARQASGDIDGMLAFVAPDIVCFPNTTWRHARYPRRIVGKEALREALHHRNINYIFLETVIHRTLIDGDQAAVHRTTTIRERGGGVTYTFDSMDLLRFRHGQIVEFCSLPDGSAYDAVVHFPH